MKKVLCLGLALVFLLAFSACGSREKIAEEMIESAVQQEGGNIDVDIDDDGNSITVSGEDGSYSIVAEDGMAWPSDRLPANVPAIPGVAVSGVMDSGAGVLVVFENCNEETANAYIVTLKSLGWEDVTNLITDDGLVVMFKKSDESLTFTWDKDDNTGSITYGTP